MKLVSPRTGAPLDHDTAHSLRGSDNERWPVVDGIPYLRVGREALAAAALAHLDAGRPYAALVALLADQDDWWSGPATEIAELERLVHERETVSLRDAMALLRLGPVADYFAYRWSDPTYLAGLALLEAHWNAPRTAFELACGIGHYLRELTRREVACLGADVVFAKCWLAKHWVAPEAAYIVFDAAAPWPIADAHFDLVQCHDAFYFMPEQESVAGRLRAAVAPSGVLAVSHVHNSAYRRGAMGPAKTAAAWEQMFPDAEVYDEAALLEALMTSTRPEANGWKADEAVEAWSLVEGNAASRAVEQGLAMPLANAELRPNPLLSADGAVWPSALYSAEYGRGCYWALSDDELPPHLIRDPVRLRRLVDLPERW